MDKSVKRVFNLLFGKGSVLNPEIEEVELEYGFGASGPGYEWEIGDGEVIIESISNLITSIFTSDIFVQSVCHKINYGLCIQENVIGCGRVTPEMINNLPLHKRLTLLKMLTTNKPE